MGGSRSHKQQGQPNKPGSPVLLANFGSAYEWISPATDKKKRKCGGDSHAGSQFAEKLMSDGVMSGRAIESDMDYSRDFPYVTLEKWKSLIKHLMIFTQED